jgi:predicted nucleic acid-binding protein
MKIAITDACIFIDLIELRLSSQFFLLKIEIHTTLDVFNELYPEQQEVLRAYQSTGKLRIYNLTPMDRLELKNTVFPRSLSDVDKSVILVARKINAIILSSDKAVRNFAGTSAIEYHGMLWIFDMLIDHDLISKSEAILKIKNLMETNIVYRNNMELVSEIRRRIEKWNLL